MAPNPFFSGRIPKDLHDRIEAYLAETNESKTQLLVNSLAAYLNYPIQQPSKVNSSLEARIVDLEKNTAVIDQLQRDIEELRNIVKNKTLIVDNKPDNKPDNIMSPGQLSLLGKSDNKVDNIYENNSDDNTDDNVTDKLDNSNSNETSAIGEELNKDEWNDLGQMHIPEIVQLAELQELDKLKLKQKLRNANKSAIKTALIEPYTFKIVGKEPGVKGQVVFRVYKRTKQEQ